MPIGNLLSQFLALLYLNALDHYIKRELGIANYCRYVDDIVLIGIPTREEAERLRLLITIFLANDLKLGVSKYTIARVRSGVNFVGYRAWASARFVRKHSLKKFRKNLKGRNRNKIMSSLGHARRTSSYRRMVKQAQEMGWHV